MAMPQGGVCGHMSVCMLSPGSVTRSVFHFGMRYSQADFEESVYPTMHALLLFSSFQALFVISGTCASPDAPLTLFVLFVLLPQ